MVGIDYDQCNVDAFTRPELPDDIESCHVLIEQLRAELQTAREQIAKLQTAATRTPQAHIAHLEALLAESQETIAEQQQTIDNLAADNALLKRSIFGSRRERFTDPAQAFLFDTTTLDSPPARRRATQQAAEGKKKRTSKDASDGVPEFLPRQEQRLYLNEEDSRPTLRIIQRSPVLQEDRRNAGDDPDAAEGHRAVSRSDRLDQPDRDDDDDCRPATGSR